MKTVGDFYREFGIVQTTLPQRQCYGYQPFAVPGNGKWIGVMKPPKFEIMLADIVLGVPGGCSVRKQLQAWFRIETSRWDEPLKIMQVARQEAEGPVVIVRDKLFDESMVVEDIWFQDEADAVSFGLAYKP